MHAFSLAEAIHEFHQGPSRELFNRYGAGSLPDFALAQAVGNGVITLDEIGPAGREHISKLVEVARQL